MVAYTSSEEIKQQYDLSTVHKSPKMVKRPLSALGTAAPSAQQPKVYKVQPIHFRELVQKLTGAGAGAGAGAQSELVQQQQLRPQPRRNTLQSIAPPPLPLHPQQLHLQYQTQASFADKQVKMEQGLQSAPVETKPFDKLGSWDATTELTLSPNFQAWFNFTMSSPGAAAVSQME